MTNGKPPAPPRVDRYLYWQEQPPAPSARLLWWVGKIAAGWRPNKRVRAMGYDDASEFFGVYLWEYLNVLYYTLYYTFPDRIVLDEASWEIFNERMLNPRPPTPALIALMKKYRKTDLA